MSHDSKSRSTSRRRYLKTVGVGAVVGLAGCTGGDGDGGGGGDSGGDSGGDGGDSSGGDGGDSSGGDGGNGDSAGSPSSGVDEVIIGANHPLTGFLGPSGTAMSNTGKIAAMHINEAGGIEALDGAKLTFISKDNEATQELGGEVEQQLIDEGAHVLTGCFSSPVTLAATQVAERAGIPHVIDVSVANEILQGRNLNYAYRIQTPASGMAGNYVDFMPPLARENGQKMDTASLVYIDNSFGQSIRQTLVERLPDADVELVMQSAYTFGQESMDTQATKVKETDADAFIFVGYGAGGTRMMQSLQNVEYRPPLLTGTSTPTFTDTDVIDQIGKAANGGFGNNYSWDFDKDLTDRIFADYRTEYGRPLGVTHAVMTYSAVTVIAAALEEAGSVDPDDINEALKNVVVEDHPAASGPIEFQENGENKNALSPMFQVQNLDPVLVWPTQYAQGEVQF